MRAAGGDTAQAGVWPSERASSTVVHHSAVPASINAAAKKPSRCGAASNQRRCQPEAVLRDASATGWIGMNFTAGVLQRAAGSSSWPGSTAA